MSCFIDVELMGKSGEFYPGHLVDYKSPSTFVFKFAGNATPEFADRIDVSVSQIRLPPNGSKHVFKGCDVSVGDYVEVLAGKFPSDSIDDIVLKPGDVPVSWWPARVVKKGGELIVVEYDNNVINASNSGSAKPELETALDLSQVRPKSKRPLLQESMLYYSTLEIPNDLVELFQLKSNIEHITKICGSMIICPFGDNIVLPPTVSNSNNSGDQTTKFLTVFPSDIAKFKAETIFPEVPKILRQKHALLNQINRITNRIKETTIEKKPDLFYDSFTVERDLLGFSIGTGGSNINRARSLDGIVSVILKPEDGVFNVAGKSQEALDNARKILEFATDNFEVPEQYVGRIIGSKNHHSIQNIVDRTGLAKIRIENSKESVGVFKVTGTRSSIQDAKVIIDFLVDSIREIDEMEEKIPKRGVPPNGGFDRRRRRNTSIRSDNFKANRKFNAVHTDGEQGATDSGISSSPVPPPAHNGNQTDGDTNRRPRNRPRRNRNANVGAVNGVSQSANASRQNSLPPKPAPKTNDAPQKPETDTDAPVPVPKQNNTRGGKGGKRNPTNKNNNNTPKPTTAAAPSTNDVAP